MKGMDKMNINIGEMFLNRVQLTPNKEAFIGNNKRYTYKEMNDQINQFADYLQDTGLQAGDRMALVCKNNEYFITAFFAAAKLGIITVPVNWRLSPPEMAYILGNAEVSLVVYDESFRNVIETIQGELSGVTLLEAGTSLDENPFLETITKREKLEPKNTTANDDTILIMYTSGTTGKPKGAMISHENLYGASVGMSHIIDWWHDDIFISVAPFYHIGGFAPIITNFHNGCTSILMEDFDPVTVWKTIEDEKVTTMMTVPAMLAFMLKAIKQMKADYSSVRNFTCGASPVPKQLIEAYAQIGISIQQVYGITEYTGAVSFWKKALDETKGDSMGKPVFQGKLKIVDMNTKEELNAGEDGEIILAGPQVFNGYWNNEEESRKVLQDGWYYSGDIGRVDKDGFLHVIDRAKDIIISGGENIYSAELESILSTHPDIEEVAVIGVPNEKWGEVPKAYVVKSSESAIDEESVIDYCKQHLASYKAIKQVEFIDQLPRNAVGKILKHTLKDNAKEVH